jgi:hypothetical protein
MKRVLGWVLLLVSVPSFADSVRVFIKNNPESPLPITFKNIECYEEQGRRMRIFLGRGESQHERMEVVVPYNAEGGFSDSNEVCLKIHDPRLDERTFCTSSEANANCKVQAKRLDSGLVQMSLECRNLPRAISSVSRLSFEIKESEPLVCPLVTNNP